MVAAAVFFFFERKRVKEKWKLSLLVSGLITAIAGIHYFYMRDDYLATGESPTEIRYIDWTLTVPLMCLEFFLLMRPAGASTGMLWRLIIGSVVMLVTGYIGEALDPDNTILWGTISTLGWAVVIYEIFFGEGKKKADATENQTVKKAFRTLSLFALIGWAIYPIGYMTMEGNIMAGLIPGNALDVTYNIGDAVNKIGFGIVVYVMAINDTIASRSTEEATGGQPQVATQ